MALTVAQLNTQVTAKLEALDKRLDAINERAAEIENLLGGPFVQEPLMDEQGRVIGLKLVRAPSANPA